MFISATKIRKLPPKELKEEYTNEFVLLGLFYFGQKHKAELGRMQTAKLLWKFKELVQKKLGLQAYYTEAYKDKHGRFSKEFYDQLNNLKMAGFIETTGAPPYEQFRIDLRGVKVFDEFDVEDERTKYALQLVKSQLDYIVKEHGKKSAKLLREEDHKNVKGIDELPVQDEDIILCPNLKPDKIKHKFIFSDQETLDWAVAIGVGERRKTEEIIPEDLLPKSQKEAYKNLGL